MRIANETKVGILAAFSIALLIIGYNFLRGNSIFSRETTLYAVYNRVDGLTVSKPVLVNGFQIGRVNKLTLMSSGLIVAELKIHQDYDVPVNSLAKLESTDLLGNKAIVMAMGNSKLAAKTGDTLNANVAKNLMEAVQPVQRKAELMISKLDSILTSVNNVLNPNVQKNIDRSFNSIAGTLESLDGTSKKLDRLIDNESNHISGIIRNVESITSNLKSNGRQIDAVMANLNTTTDNLAALNFKATLDKANSALGDFQEIMNKIKRGEGNLGLLTQDRKLYDNLDRASRNLDALFVDLKANPKRYVHFSVFGGGGGKSKKTVDTVYVDRKD